MVTCERCRRGQRNGFQTVGFCGIFGRFVFKTTPTVSKTLESGGKSNGKFLKTVGSREKPVALSTKSCQGVEAGRRAPAERRASAVLMTRSPAYGLHCDADFLMRISLCF
jgi:hypothetical protein